MRYFLSLLMLVAAVAAADVERPTVLVFGDSLSSGHGLDIDRSWPALLQERLERLGYEYRVVNASISGETTEGGAARIDSALARFAPALVIVELGGNDGLRGFPPVRIKANLEIVITRAQASGAGVVLLGIRIPPNYGPRYTQAFENVYRELAEELALPWIEFFMQGVALDDQLLQDDRIHPNAKAQALLLDNAWPAIREALEASGATRLPAAR